MSKKKRCHECNDKLINGEGIGLYCPNMECSTFDGPFDDVVHTDITEVSLPTLDGWKYTGEYRIPEKGESYINSQGTIRQSEGSSDNMYLIVESVEKWVTPTLKKIRPHYSWSSGVYCRFKVCKDDQLWKHGYLLHILDLNQFDRSYVVYDGVQFVFNCDVCEIKEIK